MDITIKKLSPEEANKQGVYSWPTWEKEASRFDWFYDDTEECYLLEGEVVVETPDGGRVDLGKGDFVTFPKGLNCTWDIKQRVRKHFNFK